MRRELPSVRSANEDHSAAPATTRLATTHGHGIDRQPIDHPQKRGGGLDPPEEYGLPERVGARKDGRGEPTDGSEVHLTRIAE
jgi:hypothetical protein